jgi:hypothetical protein
MDTSLQYLFTPSKSTINPPISTTAQSLPMEQLSWEDFEKLCLRIAQVEHSIDNCEIYGIKGQSQEGIDVFAIKNNGKYSAYQCKRYQTVTENTLDKAVTKFLSNDWSTKSDKFYFCTSFALNTTQLQDKFNELKLTTETKEITLIKWDKIQLELLLKNQPEIVYDFFGKEWVKIFNGDDSLNKITVNRKLDANEVARFRKELGDLYSIVFNHYDPGIPIQDSNAEPFLIQDRFILPDVYEELNPISLVSNLPIDGESTSKANQSVKYPEHNNEWDDEFIITQLHKALKPRKHKSDTNEESNTENYKERARIHIDHFLPNSRKLMIIGDPGYGKSTLLRYIILDLLNNNPVLTNLSRKWGKHLPVWLPFAFVTKNIDRDPNLNISELLRLWFKSLDQEAIFEIVKDALVDERLLLIIDGVDEWTSTNTAQQAISKIEIHAESFNSILIYSSRPYGYKLLSDSFPSTQQLTLARFSITQQKQFIHNWYTSWLKNIGKIDPEYAQKETENFIAELKKSNDLSFLATSPLLLGMLVTQRMSDAVLPKNKLKALEAISDYLINRHPIKRKANASIIDEDKLEFEINDIFLELAFHIQQNSNDGVILKSEAVKVIEKFLIESMGYEMLKARKISNELLKIGANTIGIIIEKSNDEIAFIHRQFQEYLAAKYIVELDAATIKSTLEKFAAMPSWHQVINNMFGLIPNRSVQNYKLYLEAINIDGQSKQTELYLKFLSYELKLHLSNAPIELARTSLKELITEFNYESINSVKSTLFKILLGGLENSKVKSEVKSFLFQFFPNKYKYHDYRIHYLRNMATGNLSERQTEFLILSLINGNFHQKYSASKTIAKHIGNMLLQKHILELRDKIHNPEITSFIINSLINDKVDIKIKNELLLKYKSDSHPEIILFLTKLKVNLKLHSDDDLKQLLAVGNFSYLLKDELMNVLIDGWPESEHLFKKCINAVKKNRYGRDDIDKEIAWKILFHLFNNRPEVVEAIVKELENEEFPFNGVNDHRGWPYLANYFKGNKKIAKAADKWLDKQKYMDPDLAYATLVSGTEKAKEILLQKLVKDGTPHWIVMALDSGWGSNPEIIRVLKEYFIQPNAHKHYAAQFISKLFKDDPTMGIKICEEILFDRSLYFRDRAVQPLLELDKDYFKTHLLDNYLDNELPTLSKGDFGQYYSALEALIEYFADEPKIKNLVFNVLKDEPETFNYLIRFYPDATECIDSKLNKSLPLNIEFRSQIMEALIDHSTMDKDIVEQLSHFADEQVEAIRSTAAINYFYFLFSTDQADKILDVCRKNVFYRGHDYQVNRQIAFCGYLLTGRLTDYFSLKEDDGEKAPSPSFVFEAGTEKMSEAMIQLIIEKFDVLISEIGDGFEKISRFNDAETKSIAKFFCKYSDKTSPTYQFILTYITENEDTITDNIFIDFLSKVLPNSILLKRILLRIVKEQHNDRAAYAGYILGTNFNMDDEVYEEINQYNDFHFCPGKIVALCAGWPAEPNLEKFFHEVKDQNHHLDHHVVYQLRFLFRDVENTVSFFKNASADYWRAKYEHKYFMVPLLKRVATDEILQQRIKVNLLTSKSVSEQMTFFAVLNSINKIDSEIIAWKDKDTTKANYNEYGYNMFANELMPLADVIYKIDLSN